MRNKKERWQRHWVPGGDKEHDGDWHHGPGAPPWVRHRMGDRSRGWHRWETDDRFLFARFAIAFGLFTLLGCGGLVALGAAFMFILRSSTGEPQPLRWFLVGLLVVFLLGLALRSLGRYTARRFTNPLAKTMKAADAIAAGDLTARAPAEGSPEFRRFAHSFNQMASALETADRQRRDLLADVAHELRTPLTVVQGNLEGLRDGVYDATPEHLNLVLDETQKLGRLVEDLRLLTLAEAGQLPLDPQVVRVHQLLQDVADAYALQAEESSISLRLDMPDQSLADGEAVAIIADPQRMGQILGNLVSNALQHTLSQGEVVLGATVQPAVDAVQIWVSDTGEGIPAEDLPRIFDRFWRGDPSRVREGDDGTGLGLAIVKSLVEAQGGSVWAESRLGEGTTLSLMFPLPGARAAIG